jgi:hypothetical protein
VVPRENPPAPPHHDRVLSAASALRADLPSEQNRAPDE